MGGAQYEGRDPGEAPPVQPVGLGQHHFDILLSRSSIGRGNGLEHNGIIVGIKSNLHKMLIASNMS
jgi:hypothetical protein